MGVPVVGPQRSALPVALGGLAVTVTVTVPGWPKAGRRLHPRRGPRWHSLSAPVPQGTTEHWDRHGTSRVQLARVKLS
jgi:hypothetical protein